MNASPELKDLTQRLYQALASADHSFVERHLARDEGVLMIGTDPQEWWMGNERASRLLRTQLEEMGGFPIKAGDVQAYEEGSVGWAADQPRIALPDGELPLRLTLVFHREDGEWKVVQWHASLSVANQEALGEDLTTQ